MKQRGVEFAKGVPLLLPFLCVLALFAWAVVGRDGDWLPRSSSGGAPSPS
jgi:hypothetical protein